MQLLVITGFLGSGKTTLLLAIARRLVGQGRRVVVIENEIGEIGIDGALVAANGLAVRELFGGCLCCSLQSGLTETLRQIQSSMAPEWVLLEPSGVARPSDLLSTLDRSLPGVERHTLSLFDAERFPALSTLLEPLIADHVRAGDLLVITKTDLVGAAALEQIRSVLTTLAPDKPQTFAVHGDLAAQELAAVGAGIEA